MLSETRTTAADAKDDNPFQRSAAEICALPVVIMSFHQLYRDAHTHILGLRSLAGWWEDANNNAPID